MLSWLTISSSQIVPNVTLLVPLFILGSVPGVVLECQTGRCFTVVNVTANPIALFNLMLINGNASEGGAILAMNSWVALQNVTIQSSSSSYRGGAICLHACYLQMTAVNLLKNTAGYSGGAIFADTGSTVKLSSIVFLSNVASQMAGAFGAVASSLVLDNVQFSSNRVVFYGSLSDALVAGGAMAATDCTITITNTVFQANSVSTLSSASAAYGGALFLYTSAATIQASFVGNLAPNGNGGALASLSVPSSVASALSNVISSSIILLQSSVFTSNVAVAGGALFIEDSQQFTANNSSFFRNQAFLAAGAICCQQAQHWSPAARLLATSVTMETEEHCPC